MSGVDPVMADQPFDRLTRLCAQMTQVLEEEANADVKAIVFLADDHMAGIQTHGYEDSMEAMTELFVHMQAVFQANGKDLQFVGVPESPEGI